MSSTLAGAPNLASLYKQVGATINTWVGLLIDGEQQTGHLDPDTLHNTWVSLYEQPEGLLDGERPQFICLNQVSKIRFLSDLPDPRPAPTPDQG